MIKYLNLLLLASLFVAPFSGLSQSSNSVATAAPKAEDCFATGYHEITLKLTEHGDTIVLSTGGHAAYRDRFFDAATGRYLHTAYPTLYTIAGTASPGFGLYSTNANGELTLKTVMVKDSKNYGCDIFKINAQGKSGKRIGKQAMPPLLVSRDERFIITKEFVVIDATKGKEVVDIHAKLYHDNITLSSDRTHAAFVHNLAGEILIMDLTNGDIIRTLKAPNSIEYDTVYNSNKGNKIALIALPDMQSFVVAISKGVRGFEGNAWLCRPGQEPLPLCSPDIEQEKKEASDAESHSSWQNQSSTRTVPTTKPVISTAEEGESRTSSAYTKCPDCNGTGNIMQKNVDYNKTTTSYSSGAGSGSVNYKVTSTPVYNNYAQRTICSRCKGSGRLKK